MADARPKRTRRRLLIALAVLAALLPVAFFVGYGIVANGLLSGPGLRKEINQKPEDIFIEWDEAVSTWPGRVQVKNLRIRGSDANVQWIVILPEASLRFAFGPLLRRTFLVTSLRPKSIQFRLRQKIAPGQATEARVRDLPPIEGFSDPPLRSEDGPVPPPDPDPFKFEVADVATDAFDDIWVEGFRYRGPAKLRGRFRLKPGHRAQIGPASVDFEGGALALGDKPAVEELTGRLDATFAEWDVQKLLENKVWQVVTAKIALSGPTAGVGFLDGLLKLGKGVHVSEGAGRIAVSGGIDRGTASGTIDLTAKGVRYVRPELSLVGNAKARVPVSNFVLDGGAPEIGGSSLKISDVFVAGAAKGTKAWWGEFEIPKGRLAQGLTGRIALKCSDGRPLLAFLGEALPGWTKGLIDLEGLEGSADVVLSEPRTTVRNLMAAGGKFSVEGDYDRRGKTGRGAFYIESGILRVAVGLEDGKTSLHLFGPRKWFDEHRLQDSASRR